MKVGDETPGGQVIKEILGQSKICCVFTTTDGGLRWSYLKDGGELPDFHHDSVEKFNSIMRLIKLHIPEKQRLPQYALLGKSLYRALHLSGPERIDECFKEISEETINLAIQSTRMRYVAMCIVATMLIGGLAIAAFIYAGAIADHRDFAMGAVLGSVGALVSVLHRVRSLDLQWKTGSLMLATEAGARMLVGLCFGVFFMLLSKSDLVLGTIKSVPYALWTFAFVAGFSERLVPQLIDQIENHAIKGRTSPARPTGK